MKTMICMSLLLTACVHGCTPPASEPAAPESSAKQPANLHDAIQRPLDQAQSVDDTLMRAHQERDRRIEEP